ncbi:MAG: hypothetical protein K8R69_05195, partial [Deltaproteobacteria bacterium]|nr:hypothetical protein [Deltaproteobacteria bacterium]
ELAAMVSKEIPKVVAGTFGALSSFAASDEDKIIQNLAPLLESYRLLEQGNIQDALPFLEIVRSNGFKEYGDGDETKGRDRFLKGLEWVKSQAKEIERLHKEAKLLLREGKESEAAPKIQEANGIADNVQKTFFDGLPNGLMDAHRLLKMDARFRMSRANLAILALMKKEIQSSRSSKVEEYTNTWSVAWRSIPYGIKAVIGSHESKFDDINAETAKSLDLVDEIERKIDRGEAESIREALQQIQDQGSDPLKTSAREFDESCGPILKGLIQYVGDAKPNEGVEQALLMGAKTFSGFLANEEITSTIYGIVQFYSRNSGNRKLAGENLKVEKMPTYVREQIEVQGPSPAL